MHLLVYARNRRLSGHLELTADDRVGTIDLWRGRVCDVRTMPPVAYFGTVAYELGYIDSDTQNKTLLEIAQSKALHGEVLVTQGYLTAAQRDEILVEQACRKIHSLFSFPKTTTFAFYDAPPAQVEPPLSMDAMRPTWRGLRETQPDASVRGVLDRYASLHLRLSNEGPITNIGLTGEEISICENLLARPMTLAQVRVASRLPMNHVDLLVYMLLITKCVEPTSIVPTAQGFNVGAPSSDRMPVSPLVPPPPPSSQRAFSDNPPPSSQRIPQSHRSLIPDSQRSLYPPGRSISPVPASSQPRSSVGPASLPPASSQPRPTMPVAPMSVMPRTLLTPHPPVTDKPRAPSHPASAGPNSSGPGSGEMRVSLSFKVPSTPGVQSQAPMSSRGASMLAPVFGPADLGPTGIAHRAATVDNEDFFEILGIPDGANPDAARAAYFRLAKLWHPDRLPSDLAPFRSEVEKVFTQMTRASATLTDADSHKAYMATRDRDAGKKNIASKPRSDVIRDIEIGIAKREFFIAEQNARHLVEADNDDADAMALAAWAAVQAGEAPEEILRATLPQLDKAVHRDTYCERAFFYRGTVHKRLGSSAAAFRDFNRVIQLNSKHVDAQREIRIFEMRARKGSGEHSLDALKQKKKK